jgi:hypothetical protein
VSLLTQIIVAEKYGLRLTMAQLAEVLDVEKTTAVSPNGQLMVDLIPEVELIIGKQPPVPERPPQEARSRFQMVLLRFLGAFAGPKQPLALFLDDLQWLDAATLDLIEQLATGQEVRHLLLIGAYRDNEVGPTHPLMRIIESIRKGGAGRSCLRRLPSTMWAASSPIRSTATESALSPWRSWCMRRPAAIRSSPFNS